MATLRYLEGDPLSLALWEKSSKPLLQNAEHGQGPFGPGHGCFLHTRGETVALFHATEGESDGSQGRKCRMQRVKWAEGGPCMGHVVGTSTTDLDSFARDAGLSTLDAKKVEADGHSGCILHALRRQG